MAAEKETIMVLKVDLQCPCCYKKIKKILCKFPEIRDQVYDEKGNKVTITVLCCNPEKIRDKLCCKGAKVIKSIEIKEPEKPKEPVKKPNPVVIEKPKEPEKPKVVVVEKPKEPEKPKVAVVEIPKPKEPEKEKPKEPVKPKVVVAPEKPKDPEKPVEKPKEAPKPEPPKMPVALPNPPKEPEPVPVHDFQPFFPVRTCCGQCYEGYGGGPCYHGYGVPPPPPRPCYDGYGYGGYGRDYHMSRCDHYFSEENPSSCSIM